MVEIRPTILEVPPKEIPVVLKQIAPKITTLHVDVADGQFVPRKNDFDPPFVSMLKAEFALKIDVHLMVADPAKTAPAFLQAGVAIVGFHLEALDAPGDLLDQIKEKGAKTCLALKLETPVEKSRPFWPQLNEILLMSVNPGWGGQEFDSKVLERIRNLREIGWTGKIKIDGGVKIGAAGLCSRAGANILVAGTSIFESGNIEESYLNLVKDANGL